MKFNLYPASAVVRRLLTARADYDRASQDPETDFAPLQDELDAATAAFIAYRCVSPYDLAEFAKGLCLLMRAEKAETVKWGADATPPLAEFWPVSRAVAREFARIL